MNKKQEIIEAASLLFSKEGIRKTSIDLISRKCGISKKTFYIYFTDKETIITDIVTNALRRTEEYIQTLSVISLDALSELSSFFEFIQNDNFEFTPIFLSDLLKFYPDISDLITESRKTKFLPFFIHNLEKGVSEGCYRKAINGKLTAEMYFRQVDFTLEDGTLTASEKIHVLTYINNFFLYGIVNGMGSKLLVSTR
ncbi:TetR/AcrR family transcriptional regulator [Flavobacterium pectinovorum]|uniref:Transcriptional regulator, TetR family n=1 Tax=Flavobacterium pectinovorum TaxID=29533 RepID=A0AB36P635_9FLAO|nr:TetR/AcrR family transcriptional regulator [Flavobacterium pectinovorum]OXB07829.1 hypothetical protein B0A72_02915 [Flavobacterium pectinovorum]SHM81972.1 transcriptional regulator, TetR family [Flavobacterium pectinovorum]